LQLKFLRAPEKYLRKNFSAICPQSMAKAQNGAASLPNRTIEEGDGLSTEELFP
jgi:hypothetical protein